MALACCSLSLLMQVHEAAAVVESGGDAGVEWRTASTSTRAAEGRKVGGVACPPGRDAVLLTPSTLPVGDYFLYKSIYAL